MGDVRTFAVRGPALSAVARSAKAAAITTIGSSDEPSIDWPATPVGNQARPPIVRVSGLSKRFGRFRALDRVSFTLRRGEILGLIGPNGAGKTTLFECVTGQLEPDAGEVRFDDRASARDLFYLPDSIIPWPHQALGSALEFVLGFFRGDAARRDEIIGAFQLGPLLATRVGALSRGQRKRALLALGLLSGRPIIFADEPFDGLDLRQTRDAAEALRAESAQGKTLFLSIHQIADAARVCDRFVLLSSGQVRGEGTLDELRATTHAAAGAAPQPTLEDVFLALA